MFLHARDPLTDHYNVEVSGWDTSEEFFVEKSELEWNEQSGKSVVLQRTLAEGAYVFVRLLHATSVERSHPVAYAAHLARSRPDGRRQFQLTAVLPRIRETALAPA